MKYQLNILPSIVEDKGELIEAISDSDELGIFRTQLVIDLVDYKWDNFGQFSHLIGFSIHIIYSLCLMRYINNVFLESGVEIVKDENMKRTSPDPPPHHSWLVILAAGLVYPLYYDGTQACRQGWDYLNDVWNYVDLLHIFLGYYNIYLQLYNGTWSVFSKKIMIIVTAICLIKTFFFLRIFKQFSYIVTMII